MRASIHFGLAVLVAASVGLVWSPALAAPAIDLNGTWLVELPDSGPQFALVTQGETDGTRAAVTMALPGPLLLSGTFDLESVVLELGEGGTIDPCEGIAGVVVAAGTRLVGRQPGPRGERCDTLLRPVRGLHCECFDGNLDPGDGCDERCQLEPCFVCRFGAACTQLPDGAPCNDRNPCTRGDRCTSGACGSALLVAPCVDLHGEWFLHHSDATLGTEEDVHATIVLRDGTLEVGAAYGEVSSPTGAFTLASGVDETASGAYQCPDVLTASGESLDGRTLTQIGGAASATSLSCLLTEVRTTGWRCGGGTLDPVEECDDGNRAPGDGCDDDCRVERCFSCGGEPSLCRPTGDGATCVEHRLVRSTRGAGSGMLVARSTTLVAAGGGRAARIVARAVDIDTGEVVGSYQVPASDPALSGVAVAAAGPWVLVGATGQDQNRMDLGRAYLFHDQAGLVRTFLNPRPVMRGRFARQVAMSTSIVVVSDTVGGPPAAPLVGAVYVFDLETGALLHTPRPPSAGPGDLFGQALLVTPDRILVGAPRDDVLGTNAGTVHVFDLDFDWRGRLETPRGGEATGFGDALTRIGDDVLVGGETGVGPGGVPEDRVYRIDPRSGTLRWAAPVSPSFDAVPALAAGGGRVVAGAPGYRDGDGLVTGRVDVLDSATGALLDTIPNPSPGRTADEAFGDGVAFAGPYVVVTDSQDQGTGGSESRRFWYLDDASCGDGALDAGEACDDGNLADGDGCDANCRPTGCGNGAVTEDEGCDLGDVDDTDFCQADCQPALCGNAVVTEDEGCDDGNLADGDGCDSNCTPTGCGNAVVTPGEECDTGADFPPLLGCDPGCRWTTTVPTTTVPTTTVPTTTRTTTTTRSTTTTRPTTTTTGSSTTTRPPTTTTVPASTTATTTTTPVSTSTTTSLPAPACVTTRHAALGCFAERLDGYLNDCAGTLVTPAIGGQLDRLRQLVAKVDQAETRGKSRRAGKRAVQAIGRLRQAVRRAERREQITTGCAAELQGALDQVRGGVLASRQ